MRQPPVVDLFTVRQASMALGISPKRVRQLIEEGKLKAHSANPIQLKQAEVLLLKEKRAKSKRVTAYETKKSVGNSALLEEIRALIEQTIRANTQALESAEASARRNEENLIAQINDLRAEVERLKNKPRLFQRRKA